MHFTALLNFLNLADAPLYVEREIWSRPGRREAMIATPFPDVVLVSVVHCPPGAEYRVCRCSAALRRREGDEIQIDDWLCEDGLPLNAGDPETLLDALLEMGGSTGKTS